MSEYRLRHGPHCRPALRPCNMDETAITSTWHCWHWQRASDCARGAPAWLSTRGRGHDESECLYTNTRRVAGVCAIPVVASRGQTNLFHLRLSPSVMRLIDGWRRLTNGCWCAAGLDGLLSAASCCWKLLPLDGTDPLNGCRCWLCHRCAGTVLPVILLLKVRRARGWCRPAACRCCQGAVGHSGKLPRYRRLVDKVSSNRWRKGWGHVASHSLSQRTALPLGGLT